MFNNKFIEDSFKDFKVLIVDDVQENIKVIGTFLRRTGIKISIAQNGEQAIKTAESVMPDIIIMDINMPVMDGYQATKIIKSNETTREIPVIIATARAMTEDIIEGYKVGAVDYVTKPINPTELVLKIATQLELRKKTIELKKTNEDLQDANYTKDKFVSLISHDLRSPFSGILGLFDVLEKDFDTLEKDEVREYIDALNHSLHGHYNLMENLLKWGNFQIGRFKVNKSSENVYSLIERCMNNFKLSAQNKSIDLTIEGDNPLIFSFDQQMTYSIIHNLISNALKYTNEGGTISVKIDSDERFVLLSVSDTGLGMGQEVIEKLFKPGELRTTPGTRNESGTGLGLVLCKEMALKQGGDISVDSKVGHGTTFTIKLPKVST